ncbi:Hypothetical predicted protein [Olea europaea subsp. europaea]|uniref:Uncharacterized protein n=1 Tax=Olea europaea subsp. europaea TaxID=158383 RepID=A0A8S0TUZ7_OLEEU|nr:Hypothetical predicted protein [Olea europaea subsp. europaea]
MDEEIAMQAVVEDRVVTGTKLRMAPSGMRTVVNEGVEEGISLEEVVVVGMEEVAIPEVDKGRMTVVTEAKKRIVGVL